MFNVTVLNCLILINVKHRKERNNPTASKIKKRKGVVVGEELAYQRRSGRRFPPPEYFSGGARGWYLHPFGLKTGIDFADSGLESGVVVIVFEGTTGVYERIHCSNFNG